MKAISLACFAGLFLCASTAPASAKQEVIVTAPTLADWSKTVGQRLDDNLRWPHFMWSGARTEGVARVAFSCSDSGRPDGVKLLRSSGVPEFDREALRAVRMIKTLHPLASGIGHDQRYAAVVIFGTSQESIDRQTAQLARHDRMVASLSRGGSGRLALVGPIPADAQ